MNKSAKFDFSYEEMTYVNVFHFNIKLRVFDQSNSSLIVYLNHNCLKLL